MFGFVLHKDCKNKQDCILMAVWFWKPDTTLSQTMLTQTSWTNSLTSCLLAPLCCLGFMVRYSVKTPKLTLESGIKIPFTWNGYLEVTFHI